MSKMINFNDVLLIKKEKEKLLRNIKLFHDKYINDFLSEDFYDSNDLDEHPNSYDAKYLNNIYNDVNEYLMQNNVSVDEVKVFVKKLSEILVKDENTDDLDLIIDLHIYYNLYNVYKDKLLDLDVSDIKFAISVFSGLNNGKPASKLDHCCDPIINKKIYEELKKYIKNEDSLEIAIYHINDELDEYPYSGDNKSYYDNRKSLVERISMNYINNFKVPEESFNDTFNIPVFNPKVFYEKFKSQVDFFIDNSISLYGYNNTELVEDLEFRLYTLVDDLINIPEENKNECYSKILNTWKSDLPLGSKIKDIFEIIDSYKVVSKKNI
ncbi:MAG: hypothetical protein IJ094_09705 [Bacilli bacterium]|nr:hypothetical protein [Bacilli bacterium]